MRSRLRSWRAAHSARRLQRGLPCGRQRQVIAAPVAGEALALDQAAALEVAQGRRQRGLVAAGGAAQHRLADAGVAADQRQESEAARRQVDLADLAGERLEGGDLRHAQVEADPVRQRTVVDPVDEGARAAALARGRARGLAARCAAQCAAKRRRVHHVCHPIAAPEPLRPRSRPSIAEADAKQRSGCAR